MKQVKKTLIQNTQNNQNIKMTGLVPFGLHSKLIYHIQNKPKIRMIFSHIQRDKLKKILSNASLSKNNLIS